jgi:hypothetical protein
MREVGAFEAKEKLDQLLDLRRARGKAEVRCLRVGRVEILPDENRP